MGKVMSNVENDMWLHFLRGQPDLLKAVADLCCSVSDYCDAHTMRYGGDYCQIFISKVRGYADFAAAEKERLIHDF